MLLLKPSEDLVSVSKTVKLYFSKYQKLQRNLIAITFIAQTIKTKCTVELEFCITRYQILKSGMRKNFVIGENQSFKISTTSSLFKKEYSKQASSSAGKLISGNSIYCFWNWIGSLNNNEIQLMFTWNCFWNIFFVIFYAVHSNLAIQSLILNHIMYFITVEIATHGMQGPPKQPEIFLGPFFQYRIFIFSL